jgi:hypothetical protein
LRNASPASDDDLQSVFLNVHRGSLQPVGKRLSLFSRQAGSVRDEPIRCSLGDQ